MDVNDTAARPDTKSEQFADPESSNEAADHPTSMRWSADAIHRAEQIVYAVIGLMLVLALLLALAGSAKLLWNGLLDWSGTDVIFQIIDRLLFVLMLVEILHTVHASIRSGTLVCEPFLIVGLIACIRRILVITLETSQFSQGGHSGTGDAQQFQSSMVELGVLALLIVVLVGSIRVIRGPKVAASS